MLVISYMVFKLLQTSHPVFAGLDIFTGICFGILLGLSIAQVLQKWKVRNLPLTTQRPNALTPNARREAPRFIPTIDHPECHPPVGMMINCL